MPALDDLNGNKLVRDVMSDARTLCVTDDDAADEREFYIQKVGFFLAHTLTWCKQLHAASELLTNFDYAKKIDVSRADHLIYSVENYLIRLNSVHDRILQLVNAIFHLCVSEEHVSHSAIISNYKVQHRPAIVKKIKAVKKHLDGFAQQRHTLIHRHSLLDEELRRIELFYHQDFGNVGWSPNEVSRFRTFRANYLRKYVVKKKVEFTRNNILLASLLDDLFDALAQEYVNQKEAFRLRGF